ncbi:MAG: DUF4442 domain-containing protein [Bacteroidales bacterium]|nr:DUF4442 domain-containing protein [Bacteroidales bacterium]
MRATNTPDNSFAALVTSRLKMNLYMLTKLPMAFVAGLAVTRFDELGATVSVPFKWLNKNPFGSIYFAPLSMAAELSSGLLALEAVQKSPAPVSMLVLAMQAEYLKKAKSKIFFSCNEKVALQQAVTQASQTGQAITYDSTVEGVDNSNTVVARFHITWTFKIKS